MNVFDIAVLGGGASGFMSAVSAKNYDQNLKIIILEKSDRVLKKLSVTGNGQGNFSNSNLTAEHYFNNDFCRFALENFDNKRTVTFFSRLGIETFETENRIYPKSMQASALTDVLRLEAQKQNIEIKLNYNVTNLRFSDNLFTVNNEIKAKKIVVCTGGCAAPQFGTDGTAYELLTGFKHKIITPLPSLVQIKTDNTFTKMLKGIKIDAKVKLTADNSFVKSLSGELLFCDYGLSGKVIFELSPYISRCLNDSNEVVVALDLMENIENDELTKMLSCRKDLLADRTIENFFTGLINKQLGKVIFKTIGLSDYNLPVNDLTYANIKALAEKLKNLEFKVLDTMGFKYAQTTIGGIDTKDFNNKTLMSKIVPNLFIAGEILNVDGECGGYNLQWAWSSGYLAGTSAAKI